MLSKLGASSTRHSLSPPLWRSGSRAGALERLAFVEEKDRLELRPRGAKQPEPALFRPAMRALVRENDPVLVGLRPERGDEPRPRASNAVRADVVLREEPVAGLRVPREHALLAPVLHVPAGLLLVVGKRQMDDVVGAARQVLLALLGREDVVRRRDQPLQRAGLRLVVALGAERLHHGHLSRP